MTEETDLVPTFRQEKMWDGTVWRMWEVETAPGCRHYFSGKDDALEFVRKHREKQRTCETVRGWVSH